MYEIEMALDLVAMLKQEHGIEAEIVGTLPSSHDIDLLLPKKVKANVDSVFKTLGTVRTEKIGYDGYHCICSFGDIDLFFRKPNRLGKIFKIVKKLKEKVWAFVFE